jgi:hypothetical protein
MPEVIRTPVPASADHILRDIERMTDAGQEGLYISEFARKLEVTDAQALRNNADQILRLGEPIH